ncbi:28464_t:CDS:2, partial [Gigaspora margarita]
IHSDRLTVDQLKIRLTNRGVSYNNESTKQDLISLLDITLSQELEFQKIGVVSLTADCNIITELSAEALNPNEKENQKFGKRGRGKRISKHIITYLEGYFLAGNADKSDRYTAEEMYNELLELVKAGSLEESDVPK